MSLKEDAQKILDIDIHNLHEECAEQPKLFARVCEQLADARRELARVEEELRIVDAELDRDIRLHPEKYGLDKTTEPAIKAVILTHKRHRLAYEKLCDAKHDRDILEGLKDAAAQRKTMLEDDVRLFLANYYAEVRLRRAAQEHEADRAFGRKKGARNGTR